MIRSMLIAELEQRTDIRFKNIDHFETYIKAVDVDYDKDDVFLQDGRIN